MPLPSHYAVLLETMPERKELAAHNAHRDDHPDHALPASPRGFFRPKGGVVVEEAPESAPQLDK